MPLFKVPTRALNTTDSQIIKSAKVTKKTSPTPSRGGKSIAGRIALIKSTVEKHLGKYANETILVQDEKTLDEYIDKCIENGIVAIDTETTGLDPISDKLVGVGFYTPGQKTTYVPVNHRSYITMERVPNQLTESQIASALQRLKDAGTKIDMFNAPFDIRVLGNSCGVYVECTWDAYIGARLLNENEETNKLKPLHCKYVLNGSEDAFSYDDLFKGICFADVPITCAYLYAGHDPKITYELAEFQRQYLSPDSMDESLRKIYDEYMAIDLPIVDVVVDMEDTGIELDLERTKELSIKYHALADAAKEKCYECLNEYKDKIDRYCRAKPGVLSTPVNLASTVQLAIILYDIMSVDVVDKNNPRGTGADILEALNIPLGNAILEYRGVMKLINTYLDKLPDCVNPKTGRIHCKFNSYGADTGRFSSDNPNMQNIPAKNHEIRTIFKATDDKITYESKDDSISVYRWCEVEIPSGWCRASEVKVGDKLKVTDNDAYEEIIVKRIETLVDNSQIVFYY